MVAKKQTAKLKMHIKGTIKNIFAKHGLKKKAKHLGVDLITVKNADSWTIAVVVQGEKQKLWEIIRWSQGHFNAFIFLNEVIFEFEDLS